MSKLKNILFELNETDMRILNHFANTWECEYDLTEDYPYVYMIEQVILSFEEEYFNKGDHDRIEELEPIEGIDEDAAIENLVYALYTQVKLSSCGPDPTSRHIGNYLTNLFVVAALLWLTEGEDEFNRMRKSWREHYYDVIGSLEIAHLTKDDEYYTKRELLEAVKNAMRRDIKESNWPNVLRSLNK